MNAITITRTGSFEVEMPPHRALPLFTAPGERLWIAEWDPVILNGDGTETGTVFVTSNHGPTTYWIVIDYDTEARHALYSRVTPERDAGTVEVSLEPNGSGGSVVRVTYRLTGLSESGSEALVESLSDDHYSHMMEEWRGMIESRRETIEAHFSD